MKNNKIRIIIGGDIAPTKIDENVFCTGSITELIGDELVELLQSADIRVFNLESPLSSINNRIIKSGPYLNASPNCIAGIKKLNPTALSMANNHMMDMGIEGCVSTISLLQENGIAHFGCGKTLAEASKPFYVELHGKRIGFCVFAEHEFSIADEGKAGCNPFDPLYSLDEVTNARAECDYLIVLYHGGKEYYRYPTPQLQKRCQALVRHGTNLIICQHSHCIGAEEDYLGSKIIYGQGNFLFHAKEDEFWNTSFLLAVDILENMQVDYSYYPLINTRGTTRYAGKDAERILEGYKERSTCIKEAGFVDSMFNKYCNKLSDHYVLSLIGRKSRLFRILYRLFGKRYLMFKYGQLEGINLELYIKNEIHRELLLQSLLEYRNIGLK